MNFTVPASLEAEIGELISHYPQKRSASLMVLHAVQEHFGCISRDAIEWIARKLDLQPINIYELVTFYPMSCALARSHKLHEYFCRKLGLDPNGHGVLTTADGKFSVEFVECLAGCGAAPVVMCNDEFYEGVTTQKADEALAKCR